MTVPFDALVVAGGAARRMGGVDKVSVPVDGVTLLDRALMAVANAEHVVCVGPTRPTAIPVAWVHERPEGGGPAAAVAAGLHALEAPIVAVVAGDMPFVTSSVVESLIAACVDRDAAVGVDDQGQWQPLLAGYRTAALRSVLADDPAGESLLRRVLALDPVQVDVGRGAFDCDTWEDVALARGGRDG